MQNNRERHTRTRRIIRWEVETTHGTRKYISYRPDYPEGCGIHPENAKVIVCGTAPNTYNGEWHTFTRDLRADLQEAEPTNDLKAVKNFLMRGSGRVDDIKLRAIWPDLDETATNTVTVIPSAETVKPGNKFKVKVRIDGENIWAAHVDVAVAPDTLQLTGKGGYGNYFKLSKSFKIPIAYDAAAGTWSGALSLKHPATPVSGEGVFAKKLTYKALAGKFGATPITVTATLTDKDGNTLPSQNVNGEIYIDDGIHGGEVVIQGTVNYTDGTPAAGVPVTISIDGNEYTVITDENGHYQFDDLKDLSAGESYHIEAALDGFVAEGTVTAEEIAGNPTVDLPLQLLNTKLADLNQDGKIDIADFTLLANAYDTATGQSGFDERADINKDGKVNIADLAMLGGYWKI